MNTRESEYLDNVMTEFNESPTKVSDWERGFLTDLNARYEKYGADTYISAKQWAVVDKIAAKLEVVK
jgi:hypothetical protein